MTVNEAKAYCEAKLRDWKLARELRETDWRAYALITEDNETARRQFVKAAQAFIRKRPPGQFRRVTMSMHYFDICEALREAIPADIMHMNNGIPCDYELEENGRWFVPIETVRDALAHAHSNVL